MSIIKLDMQFCRAMADVAMYPDHVHPVRPAPGSLIARVQAAWLVLRGRADALIWPGED